MKKFLSLICMITCVFGLTACGSEVTYTAFEQEKIAQAEELATTQVVPALLQYMDDAKFASMAEYSATEVEAVVAQEHGFEAAGYAFKTAMNSFNSATDEIGTVAEQEFTVKSADIDDHQIIVIVNVKGSEKAAEAEVIFNNDKFAMSLESAALNPVSDMGELMERAAMNTLIGMGTVFVVLILISLIIGAFGIIPKLQSAFAKKKEAPLTSGIDNAVNQIVAQEESASVSEDLGDDLELVAVIAAAIAAYEGSASTDGFVVRTIRRRR
ncbi:MAG: OadG family protein [Lachnospiraceae bacterium]|nr:OadG family protein [Lachnospiraceae bacterium]